MNFLDTFDITRSATPNPTAPEQPSLNEEVNQVIGQLGRFWGGFRKQSQTVLEHARKDFGDVVVQAQKEFSKITANEAPQETNTSEGEKEDPSAPGPSNASSEEASTSGASSTTSSATTATLFSRLQSALPPNIVQTVQNNIPESLKHASDNVDFAQMRTNLLSELQRVQGITLAQAEEYAHKSEALLRDAVKEAGVVLRDAVKVLPPDQADASGSTNLLWDGTDMWMLPSESNEPQGSGKEREGSSARGLETQSAVASRAEALLRRLRQDPSIIRHDPEVEEGVKDQYIAWKEKEVDSLDGGIEGAEWNSRIETALEGDNEGLKQLESTLVPSEISKSAFWLRFFFRSHQIRVEEEKRKALIHSTPSTDDDFSWEDEEEETSPIDTKHPHGEQSTLAGKKPENQGLAPPSGIDTGGTTSRRVSSEDSFDLVSSANASVTGDETPAKQKEGSDDGDSDWE